MNEHKVYRNIATPIKLMGLELVDIGVLTVFFLFIFNVSNNIVINLALLLGLTLVLRYLKRDKPQGFVIDLALFLFSHAHRHVGLKDGLPAYPGNKKSVGQDETH